MCGQNFDLVIRNGTVIDGTGAAGRAGDVGVTGDRITAELNPNMFAALCSWTYNLGTGALQRSSLGRQYLNDGRYEEAADEMLKWVFCNGRRLRGLVLRRTDERALFLA
jgi:lysozyme